MLFLLLLPKGSVYRLWMLKIFEISEALKTLNISSLGYYLSVSLDQCKRQACYSQTISQTTSCVCIVWPQAHSRQFGMVQHSG